MSRIESAAPAAQISNAANAAAQNIGQTTGHATGGEGLLEFILTSLDEDKAEEIVTIDLKGKSSIGDFMVVCSGRSTRQVIALAEKLADKLKQNLARPSKIEGKDSGDWVLIDVGDVIVHVFRPEVRDFYQIEKMWMGEAAGKPS